MVITVTISLNSDKVQRRVCLHTKHGLASTQERVGDYPCSFLSKKHPVSWYPWKAHDLQMHNSVPGAPHVDGLNLFEDYGTSLHATIDSKLASSDIMEFQWIRILWRFHQPPLTRPVSRSIRPKIEIISGHPCLLTPSIYNPPGISLHYNWNQTGRFSLLLSLTVSRSNLPSQRSYGPMRTRILKRENSAFLSNEQCPKQHSISWATN